MNESIRELFVYSYRVIYEIYPDNNTAILAIIHAKRNLHEAAKDQILQVT